MYLALFSDSSKHVAVATNFEAKLADLRSFIWQSASRNRLEYWNANDRINSAINWPTTSVKYLVNFSPVTPNPKSMWLICTAGLDEHSDYFAPDPWISLWVLP